MENKPFVDYYRVLECERTATEEDIKKNYKRLVLASHPDKAEGENNENENFQLIQEAWSVLKDPTSRKQYDAMLACQEHSECLLYETVSLADMEFDPNDGYYSYPCRCGGMYLLNCSETILPRIIISCDECSFSIEVNKVPELS